MILQLISAFFATFGFSITLNIERRKAIIAGIGGVISWAVYLVSMKYYPNDYLSLLIASLALGLYGEKMARVIKSPSTVFTVPALMPLVPGAWIYYTMLEAAKGNPQGTINLFIITLLKSVSIALGVMLASGVYLVITRLKKLTFKQFIRGLEHE